MHPSDWRLINGDALEAIPAALARARGNATARALARADWLLRRKSDGRYLAVRSGDSLKELWRGALSRRMDGELAELVHSDGAGEAPRPLSGLLPRLHELGLDETAYAERSGLALVPEPATLAWAGRDRYRRPLWLRAGAAKAWAAMHAAALHDQVVLEAISGYRSHDYQLGIFRRKLARGQTVEEILRVNAAPGFSEHHGGEVLDISTPGEPAAEEGFEATPAFAWLRDRAGEFGFEMSYPRDNPHGIDYEPWHWRYAPAS
ncbi:MAG: M15 family metallopeptidase [Arenimonas sp.]